MAVCLLIQCCCRCLDDLHGLAVGHPVLMTCCRLLRRTLGLGMLNPVFPGDCNMTKVIKLQKWIKYTAYYYCWSATLQLQVQTTWSSCEKSWTTLHPLVLHIEFWWPLKTVELTHMQRILQKWGSRNYSIDEPMRYHPNHQNFCILLRIQRM